MPSLVWTINTAIGCLPPCNGVLQERVSECDRRGSPTWPYWPGAGGGGALATGSAGGAALGVGAGSPSQSAGQLRAMTLSSTHSNRSRDKDKKKKKKTKKKKRNKKHKKKRSGSSSSSTSSSRSRSGGSSSVSSGEKKKKPLRWKIDAKDKKVPLSSLTHVAQLKLKNLKRGDLVSFAARHPGALTAQQLSGLTEVRDMKEVVMSAEILDAVNREEISQALDVLCQRILTIQAAK